MLARAIKNDWKGSLVYAVEGLSVNTFLLTECVHGLLLFVAAVMYYMDAGILYKFADYLQAIGQYSLLSTVP